jgi:hypothetical protein
MEAPPWRISWRNCGGPRRTLVILADVSAGIQTEHLPDKNLEVYRYIHLLGPISLGFHLRLSTQLCLYVDRLQFYMDIPSLSSILYVLPISFIIKILSFFTESRDHISV